MKRVSVIDLSVLHLLKLKKINPTGTRDLAKKPAGLLSGVVGPVSLPPF